MKKVGKSSRGGSSAFSSDTGSVASRFSFTLRAHSAATPRPSRDVRGASVAAIQPAADTPATPPPRHFNWGAPPARTPPPSQPPRQQSLPGDSAQASYSTANPGFRAAGLPPPPHPDPQPLGSHDHARQGAGPPGGEEPGRLPPAIDNRGARGPGQRGPVGRGVAGAEGGQAGEGQESGGLESHPGFPRRSAFVRQPSRLASVGGPRGPEERGEGPGAGQGGEGGGTGEKVERYDSDGILIDSDDDDFAGPGA